MPKLVVSAGQSRKRDEQARVSWAETYRFFDDRDRFFGSAGICEEVSEIGICSGKAGVELDRLDISGPNGFVSRPTKPKLYIVESRARPRQIRIFDVVADGTRLANGRVFINAGQGTPDGFRCDIEGNLVRLGYDGWTQCGLGEHKVLPAVELHSRRSSASRREFASGTAPVCGGH